MATPSISHTPDIQPATELVPSPPTNGASRADPRRRLRNLRRPSVEYQSRLMHLYLQRRCCRLSNPSRRRRHQVPYRLGGVGRFRHAMHALQRQRSRRRQRVHLLRRNPAVSHPLLSGQRNTAPTPSRFVTPSVSGQPWVLACSGEEAFGSCYAFRSHINVWFSCVCRGSRSLSDSCDIAACAAMVCKHRIICGDDSIGVEHVEQCRARVSFQAFCYFIAIPGGSHFVAWWGDAIGVAAD